MSKKNSKLLAVENNGSSRAESNKPSTATVTLKHLLSPQRTAEHKGSVAVSVAAATPPPIFNGKTGIGIQIEQAMKQQLFSTPITVEHKGSVAVPPPIFNGKTGIGIQIEQAMKQQLFSTPITAKHKGSVAASVAATPPSTSTGKTGTQTAQSNKHIKQERSREVNAADIFDDYVNKVVSDGGYVDAEDISENLHHLVNLKLLSNFRSIQDMNKKINAAVDAYWHSNVIRSFFELEETLKHHIAAYKKISPIPTDFEELGYGSLLRQKKVVQLFKFPRDIRRNALLNVPSREVMKLIFNGLEKQRYYTWSEEVETFISTLLEAYFQSQEKRQSVYVSEKDIFHAWKNFHRTSFFKEVKEFSREFESLRRVELQKSFQALLKERKSSLLDIYEECNSFAVKQFSLSSSVLNLLIKEITKCESFETTFYDVLCQFFNVNVSDANAKSKVIAPLSEVFQLLSEASKAILRGATPRKSKLPNDLFVCSNDGFRNISATAITCLLSFIPEVGDTNQVMTLEQTLFQRNVFNGVPEFMSKLLLQFLVDRTDHLSNEMLSETPQSEELKIEKVKLPKSFDLIFRALKKLTPSHAAVIMITASIVYFRLKWAIQPSLPNPQLLDIQNEIISKLSESARNNSCQTVELFVSTLSDLELSLKCNLKVPAMELANQGSFLNIISKSKNPQMWEMLQKLTPAKDLINNSNEVKQMQEESISSHLTEEQMLEVANLIHDNLHLFSGDRDLIETLIHCNELVNRHFDNQINVNLLSYFPRLLNEDPDLADAICTLSIQQATTVTGNEVLSNMQGDNDGIYMSNIEIIKQLPTAKFVAYSILCDMGCPADVVDSFPHHPFESLLQLYAHWYLVKHFLLPQSVSRRIVDDLVGDSLLYDNTVRRYSLQNAALFPSSVHFIPRTVCITQAKHFMNSQLENSCSRNIKEQVDFKMNEVELNEEFVESALVAVANVPFGESCRKFSCWDEFFGPLLAVDGSEISIVDFILREAAKFDTSMKFEVVTKGSYFDVVRLPTAIPEYDTLCSLWQNRQFKLLATLCASHSVRKDCEIVWSDNFGMLMRNVIIELYERRGIDALVSLLEEILILCHFQESYFDSVYTFLECTRCLSQQAKQQSLEKQAWELSSACLSPAEIKSYLTSLGMRIPFHFPVLNKLGNFHLKSKVVNPSASAITSASEESVKLVSNSSNIESLSAQHLNNREVIVGENSHGTETINSEVSQPVITEITTASCETIEGRRELFIRNMLRSKFHYDENGLRPPKESPEAEDLRNSLELLSASLYSSDMHFVMELVQNADDNAYNQEIVPTIKFELFPHALVIYNNEIGFHENNIAAICKVGGSTKKGQVGYIGQKGIGFKSVFSISDRPEIHSNGFHIMFDNDISKLEPIWLDDNDHNPKSCGRWPLKTVDETYFETCVRLALRNNIRKSLGTLIEQMEEIFDGKLLLFLKQLSRMIFDNHSNSTLSSGRIEHIREYINPHWTSIESKWENCSHLLADTAALVSSTTANSSLVHTKHYWWTVRKTLIDPVILRQNVKLESTEIILVFRFVSSASSHQAANHFQMEITDELFPVYAYLPTQTPCFHFMLQADFVLATSRESVLDNNDWNRMLLREVPTIFVDAMKELAACSLYGDGKDKHSRQEFSRLCPRLSSLPNVLGDMNSLPFVHVSAMNLLSLIPRESQLTSALKNTAKEIYTLLQDVEFLPNTHGTMSSPKEILYTGDLPPVMLSLIPDPLIFSALGKHALRAHNGEGDTGYLDKDLISKLRIETFGFAHLIKIFEYFHATTDKTSSLYKETLTRLLLSTYLLVRSHEKSGVIFKLQHTTFVPTQVSLSKSNKALLNNNVDDTGTLKKDHKGKSFREYLVKLKDIPMWPLKDGRYVSIANNVVIIEYEAKNTLNDREKACLEFFKDDISILCHSIFKEADKIQKHLSNHSKKEVNANEKFSSDLASFLLQYFPRPKFDYKMDDSIVYGGFSNLSKSMIEEAVILPTYRNWRDELPLSDVMRHRLAAYLAFLCASTSGSLLSFRDIGYLIPVLAAKDSNPKDGGSWGHARVVRSKDLQDADIHFGVEFEDSATGQLLGFMTAMRQLKWTVVDPLFAGLMMNVKGLSTLLTPEGHKETLEFFSLKSNVISNTFKGYNLSVDGNHTNNFMVRFLRDIGVVNFFGLKTENVDNPLYESSLFSFVSHILRNGKRVQMYHNVEVNEEFEKNSIIPISLPVFQPKWQQSAKREYSSDLLMVSVDAYDLMLRVIPLIVNELKTHQLHTKSEDKIQSIIKRLNSQPWFPVEYHPDMMKETIDNQYSTHPEFVERSESSKIYLLATTPNIVYHESKQQQFILGAHALYCPMKLIFPYNQHRLQNNHQGNLQHHIPPNVRDAFPFISFSSDIPISLQMEQLEWMVHMQEKYPSSTTWCFEKMERIAHLYEALFAEIKDNPYSPVLMQIDTLIKEDRPMIFIPSPTYKEEDKTIFAKGSMYQLSSLIKRDPVNLLLDDAPIKNISKFYSSEVSKTPLFCRKRYCSVCQASEGMFGVRGLSLLERKRYSNMCTCDITGFDSVMHHLPGLVSDSLSMKQMVTVLEHYRDRGFTTENSHQDNHVSSAKDNRRHFRIILNSIASGIWKCFHIKNALHPYSADQLQVLVDTLECEPLIPILAQTKSLSSQIFSQIYDDELHSLVISTPPEGKSFLAIDDITIYETFRSIVQAKDWDRMIFVDAGWSGDDDGHHVKGPELIVRQFFTAERLDGLANVPYDLNLLREETTAFLSSDSFFSSVSHLPIATFFAPKNILPLLKLVHIPMISDKIEQTVSKELRMVVKPGEISASQRFMLVFNRLLIVAQAKWAAYNKKEHNSLFRVDALAQSARLQRLFHTRLFNCDVIRRHVQLSMFHEDYSSDIADDVHLLLANPDPTISWPVHYELYLQNDISPECIHGTAIAMIMEVLRIEIASLMKNQLFDFIVALEETLRTFTKHVSQNDTMWNAMLSMVNLDTIVQQYADTNKLWQLKMPLTETVEIQAIVPEVHVDDETPTEGEETKEDNPSNAQQDESPELDEEEKDRLKRALEAAQRRKTNDEQRHKELREKNKVEKMKKLETEVSSVASSIKQGTNEVEKQSKLPTSSTVHAEPEVVDNDATSSDGPKLIVRYDMDAQPVVSKKAKKSKNKSGDKANDATDEKYTSNDVVEKVVVHGESIVIIDDAQLPVTDSNEDNIKDQDKDQVKDKQVVFDHAPVHVSLSSSEPLHLPPVAHHKLIPYKWKTLANPILPTADMNTSRHDAKNHNDTVSHVGKQLGNNLQANHQVLAAGGTVGISSGKGRWQEHFLHSNNHDSSQHLQDVGCVTSVQVPEEIIQACVEQHLHNNADYQSLATVSSTTADASYPLPEIGSKLTGRMGEQIAFQYFQANVAPETRVVWENTVEEQGLPFDIRLIYPSGVEKKVEVKTRSVGDMQVAPTLWRISPAEIYAAYQYQEQYFCVLVSLRVDYQAQTIGLNSLLTVGKENGLIRSLQNDRQAYLLMKIPPSITIAMGHNTRIDGSANHPRNDDDEENDMKEK